MVVKFIALVSCIDRFAFFEEGGGALAAIICSGEFCKPLRAYAVGPLKTEPWNGTIAHRQGSEL